MNKFADYTAVERRVLKHRKIKKIRGSAHSHISNELVEPYYVAESLPVIEVNPLKGYKFPKLYPQYADFIYERPTI